MGQLFEALTMNSQCVFLLGDFNCDLLLPDKPPKDGCDFLDLLDIYDLKNVINLPTRVSKTSNTLLDLILTDNKRRIIASWVVDVHVSNHSLIYAILWVSAPAYRRSRKICFRSLKNFDREQFLSDLHNIPFHVMEIFDDVDDKLYVFGALSNNVLNEHAPIKQVHVWGNQVPYMNQDWRKAIRCRNKLWKIFTKERNQINYAKYKVQQNKCTSIRRKAIKEYFLRKAEANSPVNFGMHIVHFYILDNRSKRMI